jgi:hypothetical protein
VLPYHAGELEVQARTGEFDEAVRNAAIIRSILPPPLIKFLSSLPWIVIGAADARGAVWAGALFGPPGFIRAAGQRVVRIEADPDPDDPLAGLWPGGGDVRADPGAGDGSRPVALLAIDPARRFRARINGRLDRSEHGLTVTADQVYANCMKYIQRRSLTPVPARDAHLGRTPEVRRAGELSDLDVTLMTRIDTFFIATLAPGPEPGHGADVSHRGGHPGFLEPLGRNVVRFADYTGNSMFNTFGNLDLNPNCGLLLPDFDTGDLLHLTGRAEVDYDPEPLERHAGARRIVRFTVDEAVRRVAVSPLRSGPVEYSPFLPPRPVRQRPESERDG